MPDEQRPGLHTTVLTPQDILETVRHLIELKNGSGSVDDIDHLGNRRVRAVGELMENQYRVGLVRMERAIKERMSMSQEIDTLMPHDLINSKPVGAVVKEYFGSSQLSQFMDQTNPLCEVTHKRRLSALGPGGLTRERAGFEVRDVHATHYGRICPIETPEGPNIGLIASLSTFARVNEYGFVETPYRRVENGRVTDEVHWFSALEEERKYIAQATADIDDKNKFTGSLVSGSLQRRLPHGGAGAGRAAWTSRRTRCVSVAAALVPFLEHDDANRALMGANMQRQAVPLVRTEAPLVGTGIESRVAIDSGVCVVAKRDGVVESVDAERIVVRATGAEGDEVPDIYQLTKYQRSNQSTCYNQRPIIRPGEMVRAGDVLADGAATRHGRARARPERDGRVHAVAGLQLRGLDPAVRASSSARTSTPRCTSRSSSASLATPSSARKRSPRDIPNVGEEALKDLDDAGVVRIGAEVKPGTSWSARSRPRARASSLPRRSCSAPSSARRPATCATARSRFRRASAAS